MTRVVVTGIGVWCSIGRGVAEFERALREGRSGRRPVTRFDVSDTCYRTSQAAVLQDEQLLDHRLDQTRIADLALAVADDAIADAGLLLSRCNPARIGMGLGTSHGGNFAYMRFLRSQLGIDPEPPDPGVALSVSPTIVGQVAREFSLRGPTFTISTACASGTNSIGRAADLIRNGRADVMLAGGADLFTELSFSGFNILGALARGPCRPMDAARDGLLLGDGAAIVLLEAEPHARMRGARLYAEILGHATTNEAYHATAPIPTGAAASRVMRTALTAARVSPDAVDYINLHGTGTEANDIAELRAIQALFGDRAARIPISSTKSLLGHTLGAAGSVELAATVLGLAHDFLPPMINLRTPIPGFEDWDYVVGQARTCRSRIALSNSFAFAGNLATLCVGRPLDHGYQN